MARPASLGIELEPAPPEVEELGAWVKPWAAASPGACARRPDPE